MDITSRIKEFLFQLWSPFLILAHAGVLLYDHFGGEIAADGFSKPYLVAMAFGTAFYGFLAVLISFNLARRFVPEHSAFLAAASGSEVRCRCTCTSIPPGLMPRLLLPWPFFSGIGFVRAAAAPGGNGRFSERLAA
jgi:hypothetical protein